MTPLEKWNDRYDRHWCTKEQLKKLVTLNVLNSEEYKLITGENYE